MAVLPGALIKSLTGIVGPAHLLTGDGAAGFAVETARGYSSSAGHTGGNRASVWALVVPGESA